MWDLHRFAANVAVKDDRGQTLTYADLAAASEKFAESVGDRCLIFILCDNELGSLIGYAGALNGRIVPVMLRHDLPEDRLQELIEAYHPAFLWQPLARERSRQCQAPVYAAYGYELLPLPYGRETRLHPQLALLLTTSGSTGSPKFVRQTYENLQANTESIVTYLHMDESERAITSLPMQYTYGLSIINTHLAVGARLLLTRSSLMQKEFWQFCREEGATSLAGVPYTYEMLKRLRFSRMDLPALRTLTQAGGKILPVLHEEFARWAKDTGREFVVMYGACEATARMGYLPPERSLEKVGSMGIAIPGGRFELLGADDAPVQETDAIGELVYYGKNVTWGYAECAADLQKGDERRGRYLTGDMAKRDADGFYTIVGRKKRFLKVFGNRVNLDDAERLLKAKFQTADVACGGVDDKLYIFGTDKAGLPEYKAYLAKETGLHISAFRTVALAEIPHNDSGKTLYQQLASHYEK